MKIEFQDLEGITLGHVTLTDGELVADTPFMQRFVAEWLRNNDDTPDVFMQKYRNYSGSFLYSKVVRNNK